LSWVIAGFLFARKIQGLLECWNELAARMPASPLFSKSHLSCFIIFFFLEQQAILSLFLSLLIAQA
jgi:hypothetical protein